MKHALLLISLMTSFQAQARDCSAPVKIAVIDSGFQTILYGKNAKLCKYGHKDFTGGDLESTPWTETPVPADSHGHGTNVAGLIKNNAEGSEVDFCLIIVKFYNPKATDSANFNAEVKAIQYAVNIKADIINMSGGGTGFRNSEKVVVKRFLDQGGIVIAAAGNENVELGAWLAPNYYPAMYDSRIVVVGNIAADGTRQPSSNYGDRVTAWEVGVNTEANGYKMTGTSQSAAIHTGKFVRLMKTCALSK